MAYNAQEAGVFQVYSLRVGFDFKGKFPFQDEIDLYTRFHLVAAVFSPKSKALEDSVLEYHLHVQSGEMGDKSCIINI